MNYYHYALLALVVIALAVILKKRENPVKKSKNKEDELPELNDVFLDHADGRTALDLVKVFNPSDLMILRSILASEEIETYVKSNNFGDLFGSAKESIFSTTVISIFEDKAPEAKIIVQQYIQNLLKDKSEENSSTEEQEDPEVITDIPSSEYDLKYLPEILI